MSNVAPARSSTPVQQKSTPSSGGSSSSSSSSSNAVQLKKSLAGHGYEQQAAMLAPGGAPVQMRAAVQREEGDGGMCMPDGTAQTNTSCEADPSASAPATSSGGGGAASTSGGGGAAASTSGGGGAAASTSGGGGGAGVYDDQGAVGHTSSSASLPGGRAVGASTQNGGTISAEREKNLGELGVFAPVPGVPGLFLGVTGGLKATVGGALSGLTAGQTELDVGGSVTGSLQANVAIGAPPQAYGYLRGGPVVQANARMKLDSEGIKEVKVDVTLDMTMSIGIALGTDFDYSTELSRANVGRLIGVEYKRGEPLKKGTFQPGAALLAALREAKAAAARINQIASAGADAARRAGQRISQAWNWLTS